MHASEIPEIIKNPVMNVIVYILVLSRYQKKNKTKDLNITYSNKILATQRLKVVIKRGYNGEKINSNTESSSCTDSHDCWSKTCFG